MRDVGGLRQAEATETTEDRDQLERRTIGIRRGFDDF
jgi:hypothetical protein